MNTQTIVVGIAALILGLGSGFALSGATGARHTMPDGTTMGSMNHDMHTEMSGMMAALDGKSGDEFGKAFLYEMIVHHQGAIDMAELALQNAGSEELKTLANTIIATQATEIRQMQEWQSAWFGQP